MPKKADITAGNWNPGRRRGWRGVGVFGLVVGEEGMERGRLIKIKIN